MSWLVLQTMQPRSLPCRKSACSPLASPGLAIYCDHARCRSYVPAGARGCACGARFFCDNGGEGGGGRPLADARERDVSAEACGRARVWIVGRDGERDAVCGGERGHRVGRDEVRAARATKAGSFLRGPYDVRRSLIWRGALCRTVVAFGDSWTSNGGERFFLFVAKRRRCPCSSRLMDGPLADFGTRRWVGSERHGARPARAVAALAVGGLAADGEPAREQRLYMGRRHGERARGEAAQCALRLVLKDVCAS